MQTDGFHDRSDRFSYLIAVENARRIQRDPHVLDIGRAHLETFTRHDPHQKASYDLWSKLLDEGPERVAERLVERSERGNYTRQTAPSFGALNPALRARLSAQARHQLAHVDV